MPYQPISALPEANHHDQPRRAGDSERRLSVRTHYLAPLPLPTGEAPLDFSHIIGEMNDTWMSCGGAHPSVFAWQWALGVPFIFMLISIVVFPLLTMWVLPGHMDWDFFLLFLIPGVLGGISGLLIILFAFYRGYRNLRDTIPVRFNRQRREVCFTLAATRSTVIVPWESLMAWVVQGQVASTYGASRHYGMGFGYAHPQTGKWLTSEFMLPGRLPALGAWEAIRAYMEYEVHSLRDIQDPYGLHGPDDPPWQGVHTIRNARRQLHERRRRGEVGWLYLLGWYGLYLLHLGTLPGYLTEWQARRLDKVRTRTHSPEVEQWSRPLPREQWTPPSEELVRLSAEVRRLRDREPRRPIHEIFAEVMQQRDVVA